MRAASCAGSSIGKLTWREEGSDGTADVVETLGPAGRAMFVAEQLKAWMEDEPRYVDPALYGNATAVVRREPKVRPPSPGTPLPL